MSAQEAVNRPSTRVMRGRLKLATKASIADAGGAKDLVSEKMLRVGEVALSRGSVHRVENDDHFVGIDTALDLDLLAGEPRHARALAEAQNWTLVPLVAVCPTAVINDAGMNRLARITNEFELSMREALEDRAISVEEADEALPLINKLIEELLHKQAKLLAVRRQGDGE
ncbi:hypothetical protein [Aureimonas sp. ME7]|uniref:hypothetical protein n=1 Tax=Aureimonas sp. ME7 TaxID=2744252 RepID=UPI0015FD8CA4|nr:hypothetical protein [Aureimonas sp. ME7]